MTGGRAVVLGPTGRNFGAGMSGGIAYVLDETGDFPIRFNSEMADMEKIEDPEEKLDLRGIIERHVRYTGSKKGQYVLDNWDKLLPKFIKVMPRDYKRMLFAIDRVVKSGLSGDEALLTAFEENAHDVSRVGGK
jgi:glutamate synthase (ferredoxin)